MKAVYLLDRAIEMEKLDTYRSLYRAVYLTIYIQWEGILCLIAHYIELSTNIFCTYKEEYVILIAHYIELSTD